MFTPRIFATGIGVSPVITSAAEDSAAQLDGHHKRIRRAFQMGLAGAASQKSAAGPALWSAIPGSVRPDICHGAGSAPSGRRRVGLVARIVHGQLPLQYRLLLSQAGF